MLSGEGFPQKPKIDFVVESCAALQIAGFEHLVRTLPAMLRNNWAHSTRNLSSQTVPQFRFSELVQ
jgi:hypothetical protein